MRAYLNLLQQIVDENSFSLNRTNTPTIKSFSGYMKFDLMRGRDPILPATTTKKLFFKGVVEELLWFIEGSINATELADKGVHIWDAWMLTEDVVLTRELGHYERLEIYRKKHGFATRKEATAAIEGAILATDDDTTDTIISRETVNKALDVDGIPSTEQWVEHPKGSIGPAYGHQWRHFDAGTYFYDLTDVELDNYIDNMAPDQSAHLGDRMADWTDQKASPEYRTIARAALSELGIDQLAQALFLLKNRPNSRRIIVSAWNPQVVPSDDISPQENVKLGRAALASCHALFQFLTQELSETERLELLPVPEPVAAMFTPPVLVLSHLVLAACREGKFDEETMAKVRVGDHTTGSLLDLINIPRYKLNCSMYQRSADAFLGVPFNIASYALLTHLVARHVNMVPGQLAWIGGDVHLYVNHLEQVKVQLAREPFPSPKLMLNPEVTNLFDFKASDITLADYQHHAALKGEIAV